MNRLEWGLANSTGVPHGGDVLVTGQVDTGWGAEITLSIMCHVF